MSLSSITDFADFIRRRAGLRERISVAVRTGMDLTGFVALGRNYGFYFDYEDALEFFRRERRRRQDIECAGLADTAPTIDIVELEADEGTRGLRRVALSGDWAVGDAGA